MLFSVGKKQALYATKSTWVKWKEDLPKKKGQVKTKE